MRKLILAALFLALAACSYNLDGSPAATTAAQAPKPKLEWRFKDGTTPGPEDKQSLSKNYRAQTPREPRLRRPGRT